MANPAPNVQMFGIGSRGYTPAGIRTAQTPLVEQASEVLTAVVPNFYLEISQDYPYYSEWIDRAQTAGLSGKINFQFWDNDSGIVQETVAVNYAETSIIGRTEQYKQFVGTGNREVALNLQFRAQGLPTGAGFAQTLEEWLTQEVQNPVRWIEALKYPLILNGIAHAPPPVVLYVGKLLRLRGIVTESNATWQNPIDPVSLLPFGADVSLTVTAVSVNPDNYNFRGPSRYGDSTIFGVDSFSNRNGNVG